MAGGNFEWVCKLELDIQRCVSEVLTVPGYVVLARCCCKVDTQYFCVYDLAQQRCSLQQSCLIVGRIYSEVWQKYRLVEVDLY